MEREELDGTANQDVVQFITDRASVVHELDQFRAEHPLMAGSEMSPQMLTMTDAEAIAQRAGTKLRRVASW